MVHRPAAILLIRLTRCLPLSEQEAVLGDLLEEKRGSLHSILAVLNLIAWRVGTTSRFQEALALSNNLAIDDGGEKTWTEWVVPLLLGLLIAAGTVSALLPGHATIPSIPALLVRSASLLLAAAVAAVIGAFTAHRIYRDYFQRPSKWLVACAWTAAIWVPLLLLAWPARAMWFLLTPVPIAAVLARASKRQYLALQESEPAHSFTRVEPLFALSYMSTSFRPGPAAIGLAVLLQSTVLSGAEGSISITASLVVLTTACFSWAFTPGAFRPREALSRRSRYVLLPCFLLTCLALIPFLPVGIANVSGHSVSLQSFLRGAPRLVAQNVRVHTTVVLLAPTKRHEKLVVIPPKADVPGSVMRPTRPLHIPFDGSYWFTLVDGSPGSDDIRVQHGDPATAHIHSSDRTPIRMEAHQELGTRLDAGCCRSLKVRLSNADYRPGLIQVEARLRDTEGKAARELSLGALPIPSSLLKKKSFAGVPVMEELNFEISNHSFRFNAIDLRFTLAPERNLAGARVRIESFTLQP